MRDLPPLLFQSTYLRNITVVILACNYITEIPETLTYLFTIYLLLNLHFFNLHVYYYYKILIYYFIRCLTNLEILDVKENLLSTFPYLHTCTRLQALELGFNSVCYMK